MTDVDLFIVGGGPAGSTLAWALRDTDLRIAVMDKSLFPRDKICAGWVTPEVMQELRLDLEDYQRENILQAVNGFRISQLGGREVDTGYDTGPISYGIRRCEFDHYLLQRCGAELILDSKFKTMARDADHWLINGEHKAKLIIGAGGHFCPVARAIGAKPSNGETVVAAQEIEFKMSEAQKAECSAQGEMPELFFCEDLTGYGWVVRKGDYLNVGLGREDNHKLAEHVKAFVHFLKQQGKIPQDTPEKFPGHAYLLYPHALREVVQDDVLLIGDAAGLAYPQSGEGIRPAVESALMAAQTIRDAKGDYCAAQLDDYQQQLIERFGKRQPEPDFMERLPLSLKQFFARHLLANHWFAQKVVMDRWFLHRQQAPLFYEEAL